MPCLYENTSTPLPPALREYNHTTQIDTPNRWQNTHNNRDQTTFIHTQHMELQTYRRTRLDHTMQKLWEEEERHNNANANMNPKVKSIKNFNCWDNPFDKQHPLSLALCYHRLPILLRAKGWDCSAGYLVDVDANSICNGQLGLSLTKMLQLFSQTFNHGCNQYHCHHSPVQIPPSIPGSTFMHWLIFLVEFRFK